MIRGRGRSRPGKGLNAVIFNPAIMGPGDPSGDAAQSLYARVYGGRMFGSFGGARGDGYPRCRGRHRQGLECGRPGEISLVGANLKYPDVLRLIGKHARRKVYPFPVPAALLSAAGLSLELLSGLTGEKPLLTYSYGRLSGWTTFYSNEKSRRELSHEYIPIEETIRDACRYFEKTFMSS
jgi:hypothetical protein